MGLSGKDKKGIYTISIVMIIMVGLFILNVYLQGNQPDENLCRPSAPNRVFHTIIIDKTDEFSDGEIEGIFRFITNEIGEKSMKRQDQMTIYLLDEENIEDKRATIPEPDFSKCKPKHPDEAEPTIETVPIVKKNYEAFFNSIEDSLKKRISEPGNANVSPIFEMINSVSESLNLNSPNKLYIISDMLHNYDRYSHHNEALDFNEFKNTHDDYYARIEPDLKDIDINILYVPRKKYSSHQTSDHERFWKEFFINQSVASVNLKRL